MFSNAKVGDKVWSVSYGWGEIDYIDKEGGTCPLSVEFDREDITYTLSGKEQDYENQSLFWNEFEIPESAYKKPLPKLEVDAKVLVWWDGDDLKYRRYFKCFDEQGRIVCFTDGATSFSADKSEYITWDNWELYDETKENEGK